ncbi:hypothetical protein CWN01_15920 [Klebsiella pneumoniae]|nr:hypothetical protein CWN01_15920 [Klebsiella pneumoniae]
MLDSEQGVTTWEFNKDSNDWRIRKIGGELDDMQSFNIQGNVAQGLTMAAPKMPVLSIGCHKEKAVK